MRVLSRFSLFASLLAACGGGGSGGGPTGASLVGTVYEVDGQTADRSGVRIAVPESGDIMMTDRDGDFAFTGLEPGVVTVVFGTPPSESDTAEVGLPAGRVVRLMVAIEDGEVVGMCVSDGDDDTAEAPLVVAPDSPLADVEGEVEVESEDDEEAIEVEVEGLAPGTEIEILLDNPGDADGFVSIGTAIADDDGEAELELDTDDGDTLPFGVASVAELAGFGVEVRLTETGELILTGEVPDVGMPGMDDDDDDDDREDKAKAPLTAALDSPIPDIEGEVEVESKPGEEEFEIEAGRLEPGTEVDFLLDDGTGFVVIGTVAADAEGKAKLKLKTEDGDPLPLGVASVVDLAGFAIEVRLTATGELLLTGEVPDVTLAGTDDDDDDDDEDDDEDDDDDEDEDDDEDDEDGDDDDEEDDD